MKYQIQRLTMSHDRQEFSCGVESLDRFLKHEAKQYETRHLVVTYVMTEISSTRVLGYYSLSTTSVLFNSLPESFSKKLPHFPMVPAILIGRLAIDQQYQNQKLGELLLLDALQECLLSSHKVGSTAVLVDALNENVVAFYEKYGFIPFKDVPQKLFMPMKTIKKLFN